MNITNASYLVVDDDQFALEIQMRNMNKLGISKITCVENGQEAIDILLNKNIDCVIVDFNMPVMNGLQLLKNIRVGNDKLRRDIPVAMVTGHGDKELVGTALALDVNAFVLKPFQKDTLENKLNRILNEIENKEFQVRPVESYKYIDVDTATEEIGKSIELQPKHHKPTISDTHIGNIIKSHKLKKKIPVAKLTDAEKLAEMIPDETRQQPTKYYSIFDVPIGSVLAKDLYDTSGRKMLAEGQIITRSLFERIRDIYALGIETDEVFIKFA